MLCFKVISLSFDLSDSKHLRSVRALLFSESDFSKHSQEFPGDGAGMFQKPLSGFNRKKRGFNLRLLSLVLFSAYLLSLWLVGLLCK